MKPSGNFRVQKGVTVESLIQSLSFKIHKNTSSPANISQFDNNPNKTGHKEQRQEVIEKRLRAVGATADQTKLHKCGVLSTSVSTTHMEILW